jgi:hypothetical protein
MYPPYAGVQLTRALGRSAWGFSFFCVLRAHKGCPMAEQVPPIQVDDIPLDEARRMGRGPRMAPQLYEDLRMRPQSLSSRPKKLGPGSRRPNGDGTLAPPGAGQGEPVKGLGDLLLTIRRLRAIYRA